MHLGPVSELIHLKCKIVIVRVASIEMSLIGYFPVIPLDRFYSNLHSTYRNDSHRSP